MIKSRLRERRNQLTLTLKSRSHSGSTYSESSDATGLVATWQQDRVNVADDINGSYVTLIDVLAFEAIAGASLPSVSPGDVLVVTAAGGTGIAVGTRFEVENPNNVGGENDRLICSCKRLDWII